MNSIVEILKGKKTYFTAAIGVAYVIGSYLGFWDLDEKILAVFGFGGLAFLRAGVGKVTQAAPMIALALICMLANGCASVHYTRTDPKTGETTKLVARSLFANEKLSKLSVDRSSEKSRQGVSLGDLDRETNTEAIKATGDLIGAAVESAVRGAVKGAGAATGVGAPVAAAAAAVTTATQALTGAAKP